MAEEHPPLRHRSGDRGSDAAPAPPPHVDAYYKWLGIPPNEQPPNHYRLLGLQLFESDVEVIDAAAAQRTAHLRTYQLGPEADLSQRLLGEIQIARLCLVQPERKRQYDAELRARLAARVSPRPHPPPLPPPAVATDGRRSLRTWLWLIPTFVVVNLIGILLATGLPRLARPPIDAEPPATMAKAPAAVDAAPVPRPEGETGDKPQTSLTAGPQSSAALPPPAPAEPPRPPASPPPAPTPAPSTEVKPPVAPVIPPVATLPAAMPPAAPAIPLVGPQPRLPADGAELPNAAAEPRPTWRFEWSPIADATEYNLVVWHGDERPFIDWTDRAAFFEMTPRAAVPDARRQGWRWKVRARVGGAWTDWGPQRQFSFAAAAPPPLTPPAASRAEQFATVFGELQKLFADWRVVDREVKSLAASYDLAVRSVVALRVQATALDREIQYQSLVANSSQAEQADLARRLAEEAALRLRFVQQQLATAAAEAARLEGELAGRQQARAAIVTRTDELSISWLRLCDLGGQVSAESQRRAVEVFGRMTIEEPDLWHPLFARAFAHLDLGDAAAANRDIAAATEKLTAWDGRPAMKALGLAAQAYIACKTGDKKKAEARLGAALAADRKCAAAYGFKAKCMREWGRENDVQNALKMARQLARQFPNQRALVRAVFGEDDIPGETR